MEHFGPHRGAHFEGWYTKFHLTSGSTFIIIICSIPSAPSNPHLVSVTYIPAPSDQAPGSKAGSKPQIFQRSYNPPRIHQLMGDSHAFTLSFPPLGTMDVLASSETMYALETPEISFRARTSVEDCTRWNQSNGRRRLASSPEGRILPHLPLPLHWHVQNLHAATSFTLSISSQNAHCAFPQIDRAGMASAHQEKNWGSSFPRAHVWLSAWDPKTESGVCLAGGRVGPWGNVVAFLGGVRLGVAVCEKDRAKESHDMDVRPPAAVGLRKLCNRSQRCESFPLAAPGCKGTVSWERGEVKLKLGGPRRRITIRATAPNSTFFGLPAPFKEGFRENGVFESFDATIEVEVHERGWLALARKKKSTKKMLFQHAALEFGGAYTND